MCWIEPSLKVVDMDINIPSSLVNARVVDLLDNEKKLELAYFGGLAS